MKNFPFPMAWPWVCRRIDDGGPCIGPDLAECKSSPALATGFSLYPVMTSYKS